MTRYACLFALISIAACRGDVYVRDGVTDGDTFHLAPVALMDSDPVLQSWVAYSLSRSTCQLRIGGDNPARETSFACELGAREELTDTWAEYRAAAPDIRDDYLDSLMVVRDAGFLDAYTAHYLRRKGWTLPADVDLESFREWRRTHLRRHRPQTRIVGHWSF